ncbi:MAG: BglG family transcription antiterminator [Erysipelotrichaceae bacterium]
MRSLKVKQSKLLKHLILSTDFLTSSQLAILIGVSIRTIKSYMCEINYLLKEIDCEIISKPSKGYLLRVPENFQYKKFDTFLHQSLIEEKGIPIYKYERINYIIKKLLMSDYYIKIETLVDELYVSRSTLNQDILEVKKQLLTFRLEINSKSNLGISIKGKEMNKRLCISEYFFHFNKRSNYDIREKIFNPLYKQEESTNVLKIVQDTCTKFNFEMSELSLNNLTIHILIGLKRCNLNNYVDEKEITKTKLAETIDYEAAKFLIKKLEKQYNIILPIGELLYYTLQLKSKRVINTQISSVNHDDKLSLCINLIFKEIFTNFDLNFKNDKEFYQYLYLHLSLMIERLQVNMIIRNPLAHENIRRYLFATKITHSAVEIIEHNFDVKVDINEFGYLVLYFNFQINKLKEKQNKKIAFISAGGRPEYIMYMNEIKEYFSRTNHQIKLFTKYDKQLSTADDLDLLVSTYKINTVGTVPTYTIKNNNYLQEIENILKMNVNFNVNDYFKKEFFRTNIYGTTKDEVLFNLYNELHDSGYLKCNVDSDNAFKSDELGNGVVHLQDSYRLLRQRMCYIVTLNSSILWNSDIIKILIITKTKKDGDKDLELLCKIISEYSSNLNMLDRLIKTRDFNVFFGDISKIFNNKNKNN